MADPWSGAIHLGDGNWLRRDLDPAGYTEAEKAGILEALALADTLEDVRKFADDYLSGATRRLLLAVLGAPLAVVTSPDAEK